MAMSFAIHLSVWPLKNNYHEFMISPEHKQTPMQTLLQFQRNQIKLTITCKIPFLAKLFSSFLISQNIYFFLSGQMKAGNIWRRDNNWIWTKCYSHMRAECQRTNKSFCHTSLLHHLLSHSSLLCFYVWQKDWQMHGDRQVPLHISKSPG